MKFVPRRLFPSYNLPLSNFKGHHQKALTRFGHIAPQIDLVIELRDARAPISTTNILFDKVLAHKEKVVLYSKKDLSVLNRDFVGKWHGGMALDKYMFIDARNRGDARKMVKLLGDRYRSMLPPPPLGLRAMIIGMPNVGKSTFVNTLREVGYSSKMVAEGAISSKRRKVAQTGGQPGVTRSTSEIIKLSSDPDILVYDTPGVFLPTVRDNETMLALSLVGCVHTSFIDPVIQADYLLYLLNLQDPSGSKYSEFVDHPTNSVDELLYNIARVRGKVKKDGSFDEVGMAAHWTNLWMQGKSTKYKGLFDLQAIIDTNSDELRQLFKAERNRINDMTVNDKITKSLGPDGTGKSKKRNRTAKDRDFDLRNQLFKL